jgi:hypothetical protein
MERMIEVGEKHARTILDDITFLQSLGHDVGLTGDMGLFRVDGREVTTNQLIDIATQAALK